MNSKITYKRAPLKRQRDDPPPEAQPKRLKLDDSQIIKSKEISIHSDHQASPRSSSLSPYEQSSTLLTGTPPTSPLAILGSISGNKITASTKRALSTPPEEIYLTSSDEENAPAASPSPKRRRPISALTRKFLQCRRDSLRAEAEKGGFVTNLLKIKTPQLPRQNSLSQARLDLGQKVRVQCSGCKMEYVKSDPSDVKAHAKFHGAAVGDLKVGVDWPEALRKSWSIRRLESYSVIRVTAISLPRHRQRAVEALKHVNAELGATHFDPFESGGRDQHLVSGSDKFHGPSNYAIYLYLEQDRCRGLCLSVDLRTQEERLLGISRIWTSPQCRNKGIATQLLDSAVKRFTPYATQVNKRAVVFSDPTEAGTALARYWLGEGVELRTFSLCGDNDYRRLWSNAIKHTQEELGYR